MQADGSVVVSELAAVVLVLARSLAHQCCTWRSLGGAPIFNTISTFPCTRSDYHSCSEVLRKRLARLQNVAVKTVTMQADRSVVVSKLAVVVLDLVRLLAPQCGT